MSAAHTVSAQVWLDVWEAADGLPPGLREAELLRPACNAVSAEVLARLPLGTRDALLLDLRRALFGQQMQCTAKCPACGERCEWACAVESLRAPRTRGADDAAEHEWSSEGWHVRFRSANGLDLATLHGSADEATAGRRLLERCLLDATHEGRRVAVGELPDTLVGALAAAMAQADPQAAVSLALACPACGHEWDADFDVGAFLWAELDAWAQRALADVHQLATHYGWSEGEILALSPARRARYLAMVPT
jgi:hypothetical protein